MKDLVGTKIPTPEELAEINAAFDQIDRILSPYLISLATEERQSVLRMRLGGEEISRSVARLANKHQLTLPDASTEGLEQDLRFSETLEPIKERVATLHQKLEDTRLEARAEAWWVTTALYTMLTRLSSGNAELQSALKPVGEFFGKGRRLR